MTRIATVGLVLVGLIGTGIYILYQNPRVRPFFESGTPRENPLGYLDRLPEPKAPTTPVPKRETRPTPEPVEAQEPEEGPSAVENVVPNQEVARVLLQILAAKKLADGISLSVNDEAIVVQGEVSSRERLDAIVEVVEKGRETRTIDTSDVMILSNP